MKKNVKKLLAIFALGILSGCASQVPLPSNVAVTQSGSNGSYIDKVDFSYDAQGTPDFSKLKLCVAENVTNNDVSLRDASGSFVGAYTKNYYQTNHMQTVSGKNVFKYLDENSSTLIANGTTVSVTQSLIPIKDFVKYEAKSAVANNKITLVFFNITRAQQDTGAATNDGFNPVGVWPGARSQDVYASLETVAHKIKTCLN
ncbi:hypothetical protein [Collimonas pratensis]|uniref:Putative lipoprotein n=1 Tax=Collimonas pratensis TaxID=279113 RepID=A0A127Q177_9BURK|nr:hypothetical protein [Collimonas pratensis]AMP03756.1 putative lipoprotein [Collimonas pratensis]